MRDGSGYDSRVGVGKSGEKRKRRGCFTRLSRWSIDERGEWLGPISTRPCVRGYDSFCLCYGGNVDFDGEEEGGEKKGEFQVASLDDASCRDMRAWRAEGLW